MLRSARWGRRLGGCLRQCYGSVVFTGLVQTQGRLLARSPRQQGFRLAVGHDLGPLELGESIAVNGVCLTVTAAQRERFEADTSEETITRSTLGKLPIGHTVHLERALRVCDRLGGHIVAGHVDAVTELLEIKPAGDALELVFAQSAALIPFVAEKGSIAVDGVSLTINRVSQSSFSVMVVPHTQRSTCLGSLRRGDSVNLEADVLARYIVHFARVGVAAPLDQNPKDSADRDDALRRTLQRAGLL